MNGEYPSHAFDVIVVRWDSLFSDKFSVEHLPDGDLNKKGAMWRILNQELPQPRVIKTHLHTALMPAALKLKGAKVMVKLKLLYN